MLSGIEATGLGAEVLAGVAAGVDAGVVGAAGVDEGVVLEAQVP